MQNMKIARSKYVIKQIATEQRQPLAKIPESKDMVIC